MLVKNRIQWHEEVDIVVVGYGGVGAAAAITAHDEGAQVVILEKQAAHSHINDTSMSDGFFIVVDDISAALNYMAHLTISANF